MHYAESFYMLNENNEYYEVTEITIPDSITEIKAYTFLGFDNLTKVTIPSSVTTICKYAFTDCTSLTSVTFKKTVGWYRTLFYGTTLYATILDVTIPSTNATYLSSTHDGEYWHRK